MIHANGPYVRNSILWNDDESVARFMQANARLPAIQSGGFGLPFRAAGIIADGKLVGGILANNYRAGVDIHVHLVTTSARWARRGVLRDLFWYPFHYLQLPRVSFITSRKNKRMRSVAERMGFKLEGMVRKGYDGKTDAAVYGMLREECRFLPADAVAKAA